MSYYSFLLNLPKELLIEKYDENRNKNKEINTKLYLSDKIE